METRGKAGVREREGGGEDGGWDSSLVLFGDGCGVECITAACIYIVSPWRTGDRGNVSTLSSVLSSTMEYAADDGLDPHFTITINEAICHFDVLDQRYCPSIQLTSNITSRLL